MSAARGRHAFAAAVPGIFRLDWSRESMAPGDSEVLPPALAAWAPVLGFGPLSLVLFDAVHT